MLEVAAPAPDLCDDSVAYLLELRQWLAAARAVYKPGRFMQRLEAGLGRARYVCGEQAEARHHLRGAGSSGGSASPPGPPSDLEDAVSEVGVEHVEEEDVEGIRLIL